MRISGRAFGPDRLEIALHLIEEEAPAGDVCPLTRGGAESQQVKTPDPVAGLGQQRTGPGVAARMLA